MGTLLPGHGGAHGPARLAAAVRRGRLPAAVGLRAGLSRRPAARRATSSPPSPHVAAGRTGAWVGIDGFGGAGKTTLAAARRRAVPRRRRRARRRLLRARPIAEWDWARVRAARSSRRCSPGARPATRLGLGADRGGAWHDVPAGAVVVVEGVSATRARGRRAVGPDRLGRRPGRAAAGPRAGSATGRGLMARWRDEWIPSEQAYAARERPQERVDLVVDGTAG